MDREATNKIIEAVSGKIVELAALYGDVVKRLALQEVQALWQLIQADRYADADRRLLAAMTPNELVRHKRIITDEAVALAEDQAKAHEVGRAIAWAILKAIVGTAVGAGLGAVML